MSKALRCAGWGLAAGLLMAGSATAQYAAHPPVDSTSPPPVLPPSAFSPANMPPPPTRDLTRTKGSFYTPDVPRGYVLQPVSHTVSVSSVLGKPGGYVLQSVDRQSVAAPAMDSLSKLDEMKIELALLADPATFGCNLTARLDANALAVRGFVPNEAVRDRALQIARTATATPIADGLKVHPSLSMRSAGVAIAKLEEGASELLKEGFPELQGIEAKAKITGQITLTGSAHSVQEKLAVSQKLRRLNGCTCVVNQMKVVPILKDGNSLTMVTADGLHVVPAEMALEGASTMPMGSAPGVAVPVSRVTTADGKATIERTDETKKMSEAPIQPGQASALPPVPQTLPLSLPPGPQPPPSKTKAGDPSEGTVTFPD